MFTRHPDSLKACPVDGIPQGQGHPGSREGWPRGVVSTREAVSGMAISTITVQALCQVQSFSMVLGKSDKGLPFFIPSFRFIIGISNSRYRIIESLHTCSPIPDFEMNEALLPLSVNRSHDQGPEPGFSSDPEEC